MADRTIATRRAFAGWLAAGAAVPVLAACGSAPAEARNFPVKLTRAQWRAKLTRQEFYVLREAGTERPYSSPPDKEKRKGTYICAGCDNRLYSSTTKYDSRTGWPSFYKSLRNAVGTQPDRKLLRVRTEVHCRRCGSHLGHIFDDGPKPTGKRHCLNGVSLVFKSA